MLIHISPQFLTCEASGNNCEIVDLTIPELDLALKGGVDIVSRRPFPNKRYVVASRKVGRRAMRGLLIEAPNHIRSFTAHARWAVDAEVIVHHKVKYLIEDTDFDAVSDYMVLWYKYQQEGVDYAARFIDPKPGSTPANTQPRFDLRPTASRMGDIQDRIENGIIVERVETFRLPTIESQRILSPFGGRHRIPSLESAFHSAPGNQ